jgi:glycosyltransferase involved in cell wall biosynthesis
MLSVIVLTHNNELIINNVLEHLSWCNELVVVDDQSTDKTLEIVKKYTKNIYIHPLHSDFAGQRNFALSKATGDWILYVDSDEVISNELKEEIVKVTNDLNNQMAGYLLKRTDYFFGQKLKYGETSHVKLLRLARKDSGRWNRSVHEEWNVTGNIGELETPIKHYPHPTITEFLDDINRYSTLNAEYFYSQGIRSNLFQIVLYPVAKLLLNYMFRLGFLDGTAGAVMAIMMCFHSFLTRSKLYFLSHHS